MAKVLVTGASGAIGRRVSKALIQRSKAVSGSAVGSYPDVRDALQSVLRPEIAQP
jgi:nucleoside-diphosphate-sugar epimerase